MKALQFLVVLLIFLCSIPAVTGQEPFICEGNFYLALGSGFSNSTVYEVEIDPNSGDAVFNSLAFTDSGADLNALGYRSTDNFIYGVNPFSLQLYRVDATGLAYNLGALSGDIDLSLFYIAGDITPDGNTLVMIGSRAGIDVAMVFVDLTSPDYPVTSMALSGLTVNCADISFDPISGTLYGFDGISHRLVTYDVNTGVIASNFPVSNVALMMGGIFFDAFGNLYGYGARPNDNGQRGFFTVDKHSGEVTLETLGPLAERNDGCSCPYTIELEEWVTPVEAVPCTEVPFTIEIANTSGIEHDSLSLEQTFPSDFTIISIDYSLEGTLVEGGPGTNFFVLEDLVIPLGEHQIVITVELGPNSSGDHQVQATLSGLPEILGTAAVSDNPFTILQDDPTLLSISPLEIDFSEVNTEICEGDVVMLDASVHGVDYLWSDGSTESSFEITEEGTYGVTVSSGCDVAVESITVEEIELEVDLGSELEIFLGDSLHIFPDVTPFSNNLLYDWSSSLENQICASCPYAADRPFFDGWYYLEVSNGNGCTAMDSVYVIVNKDYRCYVPNAFSPNADGINDIFYIQSRIDVDLLSFRIFSRWGELVFEEENGMTNDTGVGWDGQFRGKPAAMGVYVYVATLRFLDGIEKTISGDVVIVK